MFPKMVLESFPGYLPDQVPVLVLSVLLLQAVLAGIANCMTLYDLLEDLDRMIPRRGFMRRNWIRISAQSIEAIKCVSMVTYCGIFKGSVADTCSPQDTTGVRSIIWYRHATPLSLANTSGRAFAAMLQILAMFRVRAGLRIVIWWLSTW
jgi:hypothetical protein